MGQPTPFDQTANGVTAHFGSPTDFLPSRPSFSIQTLQSLASISVVINSTKFSGNFLWPNTVFKDKLDINFSRSIVSISLNFKTAETHDPGPGGTGSPVRITAYMGSTSNPAVGSNQANGIETPADAYPEGTLTLISTQPFNLVEIDLPAIANGASGFIVDNIVITTA